MTITTNVSTHHQLSAANVVSVIGDGKSQPILERIKRYLELYQTGELDNEPARLICEYIDDNSDQPLEELLGKILGNRFFGDSGELGGVTIDETTDGYNVQYTSGHCCTWLRFDALLDLAEIADKTGYAAPIPDWFETEWMGIEQDLAEQMIDEMSYEDAQRLADKLVDSRYIEDDEDDKMEYRVGYAPWTTDVKEALKDYLDMKSPEEKIELLSS